MSIFGQLSPTCTQGSKKVLSGRPGQVDFCVGQVTFPTHLPDGQGYGHLAAPEHN